MIYARNYGSRSKYINSILSWANFSWPKKKIERSICYYWKMKICFLSGSHMPGPSWVQTLDTCSQGTCLHAVTFVLREVLLVDLKPFQYSPSHFLYTVQATSEPSCHSDSECRRMTTITYALTLLTYIPPTRRGCIFPPPSISNPAVTLLNRPSYSTAPLCATALYCCTHTQCPPLLQTR